MITSRRLYSRLKMGVCGEDPESLHHRDRTQMGNCREYSGAARSETNNLENQRIEAAIMMPDWDHVPTPPTQRAGPLRLRGGSNKRSGALSPV